jgi:broad-specificity NMP kinase
LLVRNWQRAKAGDGRVVLICGEPGIGKSTLTATLQMLTTTIFRLRNTAFTRA